MSATITWTVATTAIATPTRPRTRTGRRRRYGRRGRRWRKTRPAQRSTRAMPPTRARAATCDGCATGSPTRSERAALRPGRGRPSTPATTPTRPVSDMRTANEADYRGHLEHLHGEDQTTAVCDVRRAGDRRDHRRAAHAGDEKLQREGMQMGVGVDGGYELVPGLPKAGVEPIGLAAIERLTKHAAAGVSAGRLQRVRFGLVGRAVVEDQHLD